MSWAQIAGAALGMGSGLINSGLSTKQARKNVRLTTTTAKELAKYQYEQEMAQMDKMLEYNLPVNQVQRLEEAGLNKALMYKSAPQNTQTQIPQYQRPDVDFNYKAMQVPDMGTAFGQYYDMKVKSAQTNNLKAQHENIQTDTILKNATAAKALKETAKTDFDLKLAKQLEQYSLDAARLNNEKKEVDVLNSYADNWNKNTDHAIKRMDYQLKKAELELRKEGIYPGDPLWIRLMTKKMSKISKQDFSFKNQLKNFGK